VAGVTALSGNSGTALGRPRARVAYDTPDIARRWFGIAFLIRLLIGIVADLYSTSAGFEGFFPLASGADDRFYWFAVQEYFRGNPVYVSNSYPLVLIALFFLTGPNLVLGKLLNVLAGALTVYLGVRLVQTLTERHSAAAQDRAAHRAGALLTFYPSLLFYSTQLVRDAILVLLGLWGLYLGIHFLRRPDPLTAGLLALAGSGLYLFRFYAAAALALSLFLFTLRARRQWFIPTAVLGVLALFMVSRGAFGTGIIGQYFNLNRITSFRAESYSIGGSAAGIRIDFSNPLTFLATYSYSFATAMFGPFPWQVKSLVQLIALPEAIGMWILFPLWLRGVVRLVRERWDEGALLLIFSLIMIGIIALFSDNIGANTRLRLLPWSAFLLYTTLRMPRVRPR